MNEIVTKNSIQIIHTTSLKAMVFAWALGRRWPVYWHHHDIMPKKFFNSLWIRALGIRAEKVLVPSMATKESLLSAGLSSEKVNVLHNGFSLSDWKPRPRRSQFSKIIIGMIGEISPRKGSDRISSILDHLKRKGFENYELWIIGEGLSNLHFAENLKRALASNPRVKFLGRRSDVRELLQELDVLFVPSQQDPLPTVIIEAGLSGLPVIASPVGGSPEMVKHGVNGFLAANNDEFASNTLKLQEEKLYGEMAAAARKLAEENWDLAKVTDQLIGYYEDTRKK